MRFWAKTTSGVIGALVIGLATPFIADWEGKRNYAYIPIPGDVPTICYGSTKGVKIGDYKTDAECEALLRAEVGLFYEKVDDCLNDNVPISVQASILELSYNIGSVCKSTMVRKANAGLYKEACAELDRWVKAGGKTIKGLVNRRNASQEMCLKDVNQ